MRLLILFALTVGFTAALDSSSQETSYDHYRLPTSVRPILYRLRILTLLEDPKNLRFDGNVKIDLDVSEKSHNITLHSQNLTIDTSKIQLKSLRSDKQSTICSTEVNTIHNYFIIQLCEPLLKTEKYQLEIPFTAELNHKLFGYYRSSYKNKTTGEAHWLSITQFEPASARSAFPCFDEPDFKAKFIVTLGHHKKYNALSNMPLKNTTNMADREDYIWSEFDESVPMSTYLVAYTVNDFESTLSETNLKHKVQFRTWARPDAIEQCNYAAEVGPAVLQYYEEIFGIKFPLDKIDQIAIPDFSAGAMENWGLVTYRETALLYSEKSSSFADQIRIASVVAHELAHQWFGNLVTMKWWTDLWLNEGFATYIASLGVEHISPQWRSLEETSVEHTMNIFQLDSLKSSHPISQPIKSANQISEIFDSISYQKGSAILRMMHLFLGDDSFRGGVSEYLTKHSYKNAEQDNLWASLTTVAHKHRVLPKSYDIKRIMDSWTLQTGYPILNVTRDYEAKSIKITQERYLQDAKLSRTEQKSCWWVPLSYVVESSGDFNETAPKSWLECTETGYGLPKKLEAMPEREQWIIFNVQLSGLYKVNYDQHNWNLLIETLTNGDFEKIHIINRAQLIDDALSLAWSGDQDYEIAMRLIEYMKRESEYIPWKSALDNLSNVYRIMKQTPDFEFFKKYMRKILTPIYKKLNGLEAVAEQKQNNELLHKVMIARWSCRFDVEDCIPRAQKYFTEWRAIEKPDEINPIPKDLRGVVYCTAIREGNDEDWQFLWSRYKNSNVAAEKRTIIAALGCSREVWLLQRFLEWAFDPNSDIRKQDSQYVFASVARGSVGFHLAKDYYLSNIEFLHAFYDPEGSDLGRLLSTLSKEMISRHDLEKLTAFVEHNERLLVRSKQSVNRALETVHINVQWKERNYAHLSRHLQEGLKEAEPLKVLQESSRQDLTVEDEVSTNVPNTA